MGLSSSSLKSLIVLSSVLVLAGCGTPDLNKVDPEIISVYSKCNRTSLLSSSEPAEKTYCQPRTISGSSVTLTGSANYKVMTYNPSNFNGLSGISSNKPIRHAEVEVLDSNGNVVQCGHTDASGQFSLTVPTSSNTFTVKVNSRGNNSFVHASVKMCPEQNNLYSISANTTLSSDTSVSLPVANVNDQDVTGGAFNILDQIVSANAYLKAQVGSGCPSPYNDCTSFTVAPKVDIYWEKGFNPNAYFGDFDVGSSFYLKGEDRLFILGGVNGDVDNQDTDHFDNSVILHEFAHFLEDNYSKSDSPGGRHSADAVIDPRLAWSEGFANFFQAVVTGDPYYTDTFGNFNGTPITNGFSIDLEDQSNSYLDKPLNAKEGNFREFSVSRYLMDIVDTNDDIAGEIECTPGCSFVDSGQDNVSNGFNKIWGVLTSMSKGFRHPSVAFRSMGLFHYFSSEFGASEAAAWDEVGVMAKQARFPAGSITNNRLEYALPVNTGSTCSLNEVSSGTSSGPYSITPSNKSRLDTDQSNSINNDGSLKKSHLLLNNQFFHVYHSGGAFNLQLKHQPENADSGTVANLQLLVYKENHVYFLESGTNSSLLNNLSQSEGIVSTPTYNPNAPGQAYTINFNRSSLSSGHYLVAVRAYASGQYIGSKTNFELKLGGNDLCPASY
ncbi:MAG: hypothetical protein MK008_03485 [Bdellovibrionales bacterium]|nr:hypothetical protein [Bdellovibrionales bacterium]